MEAGIRNKKRHLTHQLREFAREFDFFEAVRRMEQVNRDKPRVGQGTRPSDDPILFAQKPGLEFSSSPIADVMNSPNSEKLRMMVYFFGLLGPNGPLPLTFTEYVRNRSINNLDPTLQHFLDIFNHRLISLFYRAWALNEQPVSYDRDDDDWFSLYIGNLIGLSKEEMSNGQTVPSQAKLFWSGRLIGASRNADGLEAILSDFFQIPTRVKQFIGAWMTIPKQYRCGLALTRENATVSRNAYLGSSVFTKNEKFRIIIGPLHLSDFERMLPGGRSYSRLKAWVDDYLIKPLLWEVQFILKAEEVPRTRLGSYGQMGLTSWLKSKPLPSDSKDLVLQSVTKVKLTKVT